MHRRNFYELRVKAHKSGHGERVCSYERRRIQISVEWNRSDRLRWTARPGGSCSTPCGADTIRKRHWPVSLGSLGGENERAELECCEDHTDDHLHHQYDLGQVDSSGL